MSITLSPEPRCLVQDNTLVPHKDPMSKLETSPLHLHDNHQGKAAEGRPEPLSWIESEEGSKPGF